MPNRRETAADPVDAEVRAARVLILARPAAPSAIEEALRRALALDPCSADALDAWADRAPPCEAVELLDRLARARPGVDLAERRRRAVEACVDRGTP